MNFQVDGKWLDEIVDELYPNQFYGGLVPTLLNWLEDEKERLIVWSRIFPKKGDSLKCPILMCPDDCDFSCTLLIAEIENKGNSILWNRVGVDNTAETETNKVGSSVKWLDKIPVFEFEIVEYKEMLEKFKKTL